MKPRIFQLTDNEIETTYTAALKPSRYALGDIAFCNQNGRIGQYRFSCAMAALSAWDCLGMDNYHTSGTRYRDYVQEAMTYTAETPSAKTTIAMTTADAGTTSMAAGFLAGLPIALTLDTGLKQFGQIVDNNAITSAGKLTIRLGKNFATTPAATTDSLIIPIDLCVKATVFGEMSIGFAPVAVASGSYFWRQVSGLAFGICTDAVGVAAGATWAHFSYGPSTTTSEIFLRDADGDDLDTTPDYNGIVIHKKSASANTPAVIFFRSFCAI